MTQTTEQRLLNVLLEERRARFGDISDDAYFNVFAAEQALVDRDLSPDQLHDGIVDGPNDCGIDGFWVFVNGKYLGADGDTAMAGSRPRIEVEVLQSKTSTGFSETAVEKTLVHLPHLIDSTSTSLPASAINTKLLDRVARFHRTLDKLASDFPSVRIRVAYASRAPEQPHPHVVAKSEILKKALGDVIRGVDVVVEFLDAPTLRELAARGENYTLELAFAGNPIMSDKGQAYVCLVPLHEYYRFLCTDAALLRLELFESNVRDYAGRTAVNEEICRTLASGDGDDFWCFNNGVTVVAQEASIVSRRLILRNPQVVNGLQTSNEVFNYFHADGGRIPDDRSVLVRVVVPSAEATRDRIIRATNSQTELPPGALRATDPLQINLEEWLNRRGYYYERRANSYRNLGIAHDHIIGITELARRFAAVGLAVPHEALARADSLLEGPEMYTRIFSDAYDMDGYAKVLDLFQQTDGYLRTLQDSRVLLGDSIEPWRYHYAFVVSSFLLKSINAKPRRMVDLDVDGITTARARRLFDVVKEAMETGISLRLGTGLHEVARNPEFTRRLGNAVNRVIQRRSIQ